MPFGAELLAEGGVRFRLWAPGARRAVLALEPGPVLLPMRRGLGGWFELHCPAAGGGTRYRFLLDGRLRVPDPASRANPLGVQGPSQVVDPHAFTWTDAGWRGRPWAGAVGYELHVGTFTPEGRFTGVERRLDYLAELGVTAIELMPVAEFPGLRNWGYDGVLPFAPDHAYGTPEELKQLVQSAHQRGLMVLLDVVYNHFGPEGNDLPAYAPAFFSARHRTPWGPALNFDGPGCAPVRAFFIHNALYWLEEFRFDGLRLDAVHAIMDDSRPHFLEELASAVQAGPGKDRLVHLVLENERNEVDRLDGGRSRPGRCTAQWNDDFHHAMHVLVTGETGGYYAEPARDPAGHLGLCLTRGFSRPGPASAIQGGEPADDPPLQAFLNFLQNHDQVGNRRCGERLGALAPAAALAMATAVLLLAPSPPMLFMGEEFGALTPFLYFCDYQDPLATAVREGRAREWPGPPGGSPPDTGIPDPDPDPNPDPNAESTFARSRLDWNDLRLAANADCLALHRQLLALRRTRIVPCLGGPAGGPPVFSRVGGLGLVCVWSLGDGSRLTLLLNPGPEPCAGFTRPPGTILFALPAGVGAQPFGGELPPWAALWFLAGAPEGGAA